MTRDLDLLIMTDSGYDTYVCKHNRDLRPNTQLLFEREITTNRPLTADERQRLFQLAKATLPGAGLAVCMIVDHRECNHLFLVTAE